MKSEVKIKVVFSSMASAVFQLQIFVKRFAAAFVNLSIFKIDKIYKSKIKIEN